MGKYDQLAIHLSKLKNDGTDMVTLSFQEIENILGFILPQSARDHSAWWGNNKKGHSHAIWLDVGFKAYNANLSTERVTFVKESNIAPIVKQDKKHTSFSRGSRRATFERMDGRVGQLVSGFDEYIEFFDKSNLFTGPSWYFHLRTMMHLRNVQLPNILFNEEDPFYELLYATLASWGMHRMGSKGAKLVEYETFRDSIITQKDRILALKDVSILSMSEEELWRVRDELWNILGSLKISATRAKLVANSKTLHHLLPNVVPPIDREYTLQFFYGNKMYSDDQKKFKEIYPRVYQIAQQCKPQIERTIARTPFHSGPTKVIDNAIVGYVLKEIKTK